MTRTTEQLRERIRGLEITLQHKNWEAVKADLECLRELLAVREAQSVPVKFAGWGLYHAERDEFGSWLKSTPETDKSHAITKHGYVNVKLYTAQPVPAVPNELPNHAGPTEGQLIAFAERHRLKLDNAWLLQIWEDAISLAAAPTPTKAVNDENNI
ncbi:hypothetical protein AB4K08_00815 [Serratia fonticola]|uniref:hypothetical protein n=1 Tax=Serratia fonticola TaxID=47917 RepID=UPI0034C60BF2